MVLLDMLGQYRAKGKAEIERLNRLQEAYENAKMKSKAVPKEVQNLLKMEQHLCKVIDGAILVLIKRQETRINRTVFPLYSRANDRKRSKAALATKSAAIMLDSLDGTLGDLIGTDDDNLDLI
jgi:hypothetical protein